VTILPLRHSSKLPAIMANLPTDPDTVPTTEPALTEPAGGVNPVPPPAAPLVRHAGLLDRFLPGKRRRFARRVSRELQALHASVAQAHPELRGLDLYRRIAMERLQTTPEGADALLRKADENFAWWPTTRELTFIDVVHMIAIEEYHAAYPQSAWIRADMARIVAEEVDHAL